MKNYTLLYERSDWQNGDCPKCAGDKRCSQTNDGALGVCYKNFKNALNVKEGVLGTYGTFIYDPVALKHRENYAQKNNLYPIASSRTTTAINLKKSIEPIDTTVCKLLNDVYSNLVNQWVLSNEHRSYLVERGFCENQISAGKYKTSSNHQTILNDLEKKFGHELSRVPGFIQILGKFHLRTSGDLVIPTTNYLGQIINFRIRDTSPNCPKDLRYRYLTSRSKNYTAGLKAYLSAHVVIPAKITDQRLWITEGEFKSQTAAEKIGARFISIPGVGMWSLALEAIDYFNPTEIVICFDSDLWEKREVAQHFLNLTNNLREKNYEVSIANW